MAAEENTPASSLSADGDRGPAMQLGSIGLGNMGMPTARRLVAAGHEATVCDLDQGKTEQLQAEGARPAASPSALANCVGTIFTSLPDAAALEEVASGKSGIVRGNAVVRVVDLSTVGPNAAEKVGAILARRDIGYGDAMIDVINAGSGRNSASQDKFPTAILTGTFDYGFAPGLMRKERAAGVSVRSQQVADES
jgi:3-hydroxyisobutyrate dehydrogenase-like beta-hydroxyacid dehydrogenase